MIVFMLVLFSYNPLVLVKPNHEPRLCVYHSQTPSTGVCRAGTHHSTSRKNIKSQGTLLNIQVENSFTLIL